MKKISALFLIVFLTNAIQAQKTTISPYAATDKTMLQIPDSLTTTSESIAGFIKEKFKTDNEKTRAAFIWVATKIDYDVANMFAINFYQKKEEKILKPLSTRKGICENFAALFQDICIKSGVKAYLIEGYTRQNGFVDYIPHAWCAALIDSSWYLFDPTWGSGYINNGKFYKKINNDYYKVNPATLIKSHMPFDYLWQFLNYPVTNQEFYEGKTQQNKSKPFFNYVDSIKVYEQSGHSDQLVASADRIERNGVKNSLIIDRLQHIRLEIENNRRQETVDIYNAAVADYNLGVDAFNEFVNYRNKQFTPAKPDPEIQSMLDKSENKLTAAKSKLNDLQGVDANLLSSVSQLNKSIDDVSVRVKEQQDWLKIYFSKNKSGRKSMFYETKVTWFGIPLTK